MEPHTTAPLVCIFREAFKVTVTGGIYLEVIELVIRSEETLTSVKNKHKKLLFDVILDYTRRNFKF